MARINKALLRKAKHQLQTQAKSEDAAIAENAQNVLSRRKNRRAERRETVREAEFERPITKLVGTFQLVNLFKSKRKIVHTIMLMMPSILLLVLTTSLGEIEKRLTLI